jgi:hypothetical protein
VFSLDSHYDKSAQDGCESDSESETKTVFLINEENRTGQAKFCAVVWRVRKIKPIMSST